MLSNVPRSPSSQSIIQTSQGTRFTVHDVEVAIKPMEICVERCVIVFDFDFPRGLINMYTRRDFLQDKVFDAAICRSLFLINRNRFKDVRPERNLMCLCVHGIFTSTFSVPV